MHEPVLLKQTIEMLQPKEGDSYLDATAGYGGHAREILTRTKNYNHSVLVDRDKAANDHLIKEFGNLGVLILRDDFYSAAETLLKQTRKFDLILADLGVSSLHLDKASRGFSFSSNGPLDMRMDQRQELTAEIIVNEWDEHDIEQILRLYGEEPRAKRIARSIVGKRPLKNTEDLANAVVSATGRKIGKHPATRTFQAIRIAVNDELRLIEKVIPLWVELLNPGGRLGIISFHSLEDRIVKHYFAELGGDRYDSTLKLLTKQPVAATNLELEFNPRSRSAKLRVAAKIKK
jgi:16S rRNA (cytosine1402-N4)-methyltransferase